MLIGSLALCSAALASSGGRIISAQGVRVVVPAEWQRAQAAGAGAVTDPQTLLVVATKGVRPRASQCQIAAYSVPPAGAVVVVVGWKSLALSGAQHDKPGRGPLSKLRAVHRPSFECFSGRGAAASLVLRGKAYQVNVMVGNRASKERVAEALIVGRSFNLSPATPALWGDGVRFALPPGWSGHIRTSQSTPPIAVLQTGNFKLPTGDDDTGTNAHTRMTARSIFIVMLEAGSGDTGFSYKPRARPITITRRDLLPMFEGVPSNYGFARTFFASHGRRFQLWVEFGSKPVSAVTLREANAALRGLRVSAIR